ncbi:response regulator transcription factor, partial [Fulvivirga sp. RKSG066]|uniref:response regulator transcription factor n=1 Tax=Fulvivirga aurantia TaxID=2529383 RepID=UPI0012BC5BB1
LIKLTEYSLFLSNLKQEVIVVVAATAFIILGVYVGSVLARKPTNDKEALNVSSAHEVGISKRELEVLGQMALGKSNNEIAESLHISENTVKTHVSNLLSKLNAKRRTEALKKAREIGILSHS